VEIGEPISGGGSFLSRAFPSHQEAFHDISLALPIPPAEIAFTGAVGKTAARAAILDALGVLAGGGILRTSNLT